MMSTKFAGLQIIHLGAQRHLAQPLNSVHQRYLNALGLTQHDLLNPHAIPQ